MKINFIQEKPRWWFQLIADVQTNFVNISQYLSILVHIYSENLFVLLLEVFYLFSSYIVLRIWQLNPYLLNSITLTLEEEKEAWLEWLEYIYSIINGLVKTMFGVGGGWSFPCFPLLLTPQYWLAPGHRMPPPDSAGVPQNHMERPRGV